MPRSSATSSPTSPPSQASRDAPQHRPVAVFNLGPPEIPLAAPLAPVLPRARRGHLCIHREPLPLTPSSTPRLRPLAAISTEPEHSAPPATPSSWPQPRGLETERVTAFATLLGGRSPSPRPCCASQRRTRARPSSGRRRELRSGELRRPHGHPPTLDAGESGLRPDALSHSPRRL